MLLPLLPVSAGRRKQQLLPIPSTAGYYLDCAVCQHRRLFDAVTSARDQSGFNVAHRQPVGA